MTLRWGIVGVGIAGRARARAMQARGDALVAVHRGRFAADAGVPELDTLEALLDRVDAVVVASPSEVHARHVRAALDAGCHVVCEYPLCRTAQEATSLFDHARTVGRVLHVEHIERLSATTRALAAQVEGRPIGPSTMTFSSGGDPHADGAEHAWANLSRVHRIEAVLGRVTHWTTQHADGARWAGTIHTGLGAVEATWLRGPAHRRGLDWTLTVGGARWHVDGRTLSRDGEPVALGPTSLFLEDLAVAVGRIRGEGGPYVSDDDIVRILGLCDAMGVPGRGVATTGGVSDVRDGT